MGRPRIYTNRAEQQAAYRQRQEQARTLPGVVRWLEDLVSQGVL